MSIPYSIESQAIHVGYQRSRRRDAAKEARRCTWRKMAAEAATRQVMVHELTIEEGRRLKPPLRTGGVVWPDRISRQALRWIAPLCEQTLHVEPVEEEPTEEEVEDGLFSTMSQSHLQ